MMRKFGIILATILFTSVGVLSNTLADTNISITKRPILIANIDWAYDFFLCQSDHTGHVQTYSCRQYEENNQAYRLYYRGGNTPKAVAIVSGRMPNESFQFFDLEQPGLPTYDITPPDGVPETATFLGTGVCKNSESEKLPCGVFEHRPARNLNIFRYMVFYHHFGGGPIEIVKQLADPNPDAMPAEIFYQLGLRFVKTSCCYADGVAYLQQAKNLFPDSMLYHEAYNRYKIGPASVVAQASN